MEEMNRRKVLGLLGTAGTTVAAGCLGSGGKPETSQNREGYGTKTFDWFPETNNTERELGFLAYSRPADIAGSVGDERASQYEEKGFFVPNWADIKMEDVPEAINSEEWAVRVIEPDISGQLEENLSKISDFHGFNLYNALIEKDGGKYEDLVVAYDGERAVSLQRRDITTNDLAENLDPMLERMDGEGTPFIEEKPSGSAANDAEFDDALEIAFQTSPEQGETLMRGYDFSSDSLTVSVYGATEDGKAVETTAAGIDGTNQTLDLDEYQGKLL